MTTSPTKGSPAAWVVGILGALVVCYVLAFGYVWHCPDVYLKRTPFDPVPNDVQQFMIENQYIGIDSLF